MKLKPRNFPHPVLHPLTDDITRSYFLGNIVSDEEVNGFLNFEFEIKLKNETLSKHFEQGEVHINIHIECVSTMQRLSYKIDRTNCTILRTNGETNIKTQISIESSLLNKKVDVNYFILANFPLNNYINSSMHSDFQGATFNIEKGDILALAITQTIHLEKEELVTANSIFKIAKDTSANAAPMSIAMNNNQIEIIIPASTHDKIGKLKNLGNDMNKVLISMIYYPVLLDVLHNISHDSGELEEFEGLDWYRTLDERLRKLGLDINALNHENLHSLAYTILYKANDEPWIALEAIVYREDSEDNE